MAKYLSVAIAYAVYKVEDDMFEMLTSGELAQPPLVLLEVMTLNGQAERVGTVGSIMVNPNMPEDEEEEDEEDPPEGSGPWVEDG